jgi:hypothetical protein
MTVKIHNKPCNNLLAAKIQAFQTICPQAFPQKPLGSCHVPTQLAGKSSFLRINGLA